MKVKNCTSCVFAKRCRHIIKYYPRDYHAVGMTFYYMWCDLCKKRCADVKKQECKRKEQQ